MSVPLCTPVYKDKQKYKWDLPPLWTIVCIEIHMNSSSTFFHFSSLHLFFAKYKLWFHFKYCFARVALCDSRPSRQVRLVYREKKKNAETSVERIISIDKIDLFHTIWYYIKLQKYYFIGILSYIYLYCRFVQWVSREIIRVIAIKEKL